MLPLTGEFDMTFFPLEALLLNRIPLLGRTIKFRSLQLFLAGPTFDAFRRWAVTNPVFIHADPLVEQDRKLALTTTKLLQRAKAPPGRLTNFYVWLRKVPDVAIYPLKLLSCYSRVRGSSGSSSDAASPSSVDRILNRHL
jgi:hypothetical protein